jgi:hypothetical protein
MLEALAARILRMRMFRPKNQDGIAAVWASPAFQNEVAVDVHCLQLITGEIKAVIHSVALELITSTVDIGPGSIFTGAC